jgi:hypothetical protein
MPNSVNLALSKNATASSYVMPYAPGRAVDGSVTVPTSRWLCNTVPSWLNVDLGAQYSINRWVVRNMGVAGWKTPDYSISDFKLQCSNDNTNWTDIDAVSNNTAAITDRTFTKVKCRYVRVYVTRGLQTNNKLASFMELEVYQAPASALLTGLTLSQGTLTPVFASSTFNYSSSVDYSNSSITLTPIAEDSKAVIKVNGTVVASGTQSSPINLNVGVNNITVQVTAADGLSQNTYAIAVTRQNSSNLTNLVATVNGNNVVNGFAKTTTSYNANVGYDGSSIIVTPTVEDQTATTVISINGSTIPSGQSASLNVGSNTITVTVNATGVASTIYTLTVVRASSAYLTKVDVTYKSGKSNTVISVPIVKNQVEYNANILDTATSVMITAYSEDPNAKILVNGNQNLTNGQVSSAINVTVGVTRIPIVVTSNIGTDNISYGITVV